MIAPQVAELIVADRIAGLHRQACTARLAALVRCCQPRAWTRAARRVTQGLTQPHRDELATSRNQLHADLDHGLSRAAQACRTGVGRRCRNLRGQGGVVPDGQGPAA